MLQTSNGIGIKSNQFSSPRLLQSSEIWMKKAKDSSDHARRHTNNKPWKSRWPARVANMVVGIRKSWDAIATSVQIALNSNRMRSTRH